MSMKQVYDASAPIDPAPATTEAARVPETNYTFPPVSDADWARLIRDNIKDITTPEEVAFLRAPEQHLRWRAELYRIQSTAQNQESTRKAEIDELEERSRIRCDDRQLREEHRIARIEYNRWKTTVRAFKIHIQTKTSEVKRLMRIQEDQRIQAQIQAQVQRASASQAVVVPSASGRLEQAERLLGWAASIIPPHDPWYEAFRAYWNPPSAPPSGG